MVRIHDVYEMHTIFSPGFPGLLESFYVQERLIEYLMPPVFTSFVSEDVSSRADVIAEWPCFPHSAKAYDIRLIICNQVVHHTILQYDPISNAAENMGCSVFRGKGHTGNGIGCRHMGFQRCVRDPDPALLPFLTSLCLQNRCRHRTLPLRRS